MSDGGFKQEADSPRQLRKAHGKSLAGQRFGCSRFRLVLGQQPTTARHVLNRRGLRFGKPPLGSSRKLRELFIREKIFRG